MSLLKKHGIGIGSKSKKSEDLPSPTEVRPSPKLFRKSASIDPPDGERPASRQSAGGKKKIFPSFLSSLFGSNSNKPAETPPIIITTEPAEQVVPVPEEKALSGKNSTSHESINSVLSSSSFSFVNPSQIGGKRVKGKRIPVDDPNYGCIAAPASNSNSKSGESSAKKTLGNTLEKIGIKIGLKSKYNLQSCESLQYIDACDEPNSNEAAGSSSPKASPIKEKKFEPHNHSSNKAPLTGQTEPGTNETTTKELSAECQAISKHFSDEPRHHPQENINVLTAIPYPIAQVVKKVKVKSFAESSAQTSVPKPLKATSEISSTPLPPPPLPETPPPSKDLPEPTTTKPGLSLSTEKSTSPSAAAPPAPQKLEDSSNKITTPAAAAPPTSQKLEDSSNKITTPAAAAPPAPQKLEDSSNKIATPLSDPKATTNPATEVKNTKTEAKSEPKPEPVPSTSRAALALTENSVAVPPMALQITPGSSSTWGNSGRRKRRAPQPPVLIPTFSGEEPSSTTTSVVADTPNDVPASTSQAARLTKFTRIKQSPPPPPRSSVPFEIRPRKRELSADPPPVIRPTSTFATASSSHSNTLLSHHGRFHQHKRSNSEGVPMVNTNTKGRIHKVGKKKAPPPPNPFGDPDATEEETASAEPEPNTTESNALNPLASEPPAPAPSRTTLTLTSSLPPPVKARHRSSVKMDSNPFTEDDSNNTSQQLSLTQHTTSTAVPTTSTTSTTTTTTSNDVGGSTQTPTTNASTSTVTTSSSQPTQPTPALSDCSPDVDEEIRQNMLNDQQERLINQNNSQQQEAIILPLPVESINADIENRENQEQSLPSRNTVISEQDVQAAQHSLEVLSASVTTTSIKKDQTPAADPNAKAKLLELKKEADKSPLNVLRNKTRPASIGSSIYESPLGLLLGRSSNSNVSNNAESGGEGSPKIPHKPWYKSTALSKFAPHRSKQTTPIKPFTSLVKFSELDKEATRIVEENRRKSAEQRQEDTDQEIIDIFYPSFDNGENEPVVTTSAVSSSAKSASSSKVLTTAQVHPIAEEAGESSKQASTRKISSTSAKVTENGTSTSSVSAPGSQVAAGSAPTSASNGNSSPPTFHSVHAASKHRQIKPLLTSSPITNVRSEKLAIVQPQANNAKKSEATNTPARSVSSCTTPAVTTSSPSVTSQPTTPLLTVSSSTRTDSTSITTPASTTASVSHQTQTSTSTSTATTPLTSSTGNKPTEPEWDCPRCTLKNPSWRILCEICFQRKDPPASTGSFMSSILQRVNSDTNNKLVTTQTATINRNSFTMEPEKTPRTPSSLITTFSSVSSSSSSSSSASASVITSNFSPTATTTTTSTFCNRNAIPSATEHQRPPPQITTKPETRQKEITEPSVEKTKDSNITTSKKFNIPPCENFLSQLPPKDDISKEEKLHGIKLHDDDDPEMEELDVGKLREVRLAYFQKQAPSNDSANIRIQRMTTNDLGGPSFSERKDKVITTSHINKIEQQQQMETMISDGEDDFLDAMLQLDANCTDNTTANILSDSAPQNTPLTGTVMVTDNSIASAPNINNTTQISDRCGASSPSVAQLQNRYRPKLAAIREGNSQDYTYCYSSSEIAQIYENWQQAHETNSNTKNLVTTPIIPSGIPSSQRFPQSQLQLHQQPPSMITSPVQRLHDAYPLAYSANGSATAPLVVTATNSVPILPTVLVDHQPYANNRLSGSPEENYVNTVGVLTPTLNETTNFSRTASPIPLCVQPFPFFGHQQPHLPPIDSLSISGAPHHFVDNRDNNYENNNMSVTPGATSSRRLTIDDYRRMGAIPKGFNSFNSKPNNDESWSSESSGDTDSSRGFWGRGSSGFQDSFSGMTRRGTLDFTPQDLGFPDQTVAVGNLMKRLEAAIANGDHRLAATLAHDLALMKVNCVVAKITQPYTIRVYVEDRSMQQGPFLVQVSSMMTVRDLKAKIENDWGIPSVFQKWILGRKMAEDDNQALSLYEMAQDSMAFLFLVTPEMGNVHSGIVSLDNNNKANCNGSNEVPVVSDLSTCSATAPSFARNIHDRKSMSPALTSTHAYNNVNEAPSVAHLYNNTKRLNSNEDLSTTNKSPGLKSVPSNSKSSVDNKKTGSPISPRKTSSAARTVTTKTSAPIVSSEEGKDNNNGLLKEESPPPPLPCRSPIPHALPPQSKSRSNSSSGPQKSQKTNVNQTKSVSKTPDRVASNSGSLTKPASKNTKHEGKVNHDALSAASALTFSLQQKLAEFKAVTEQTFAKSGFSMSASPKPPRHLSSKEQSPAPVSTKTKVATSSSKSETKEVKAIPRKSGKSQVDASSFKDKSFANISRSTEKLASKNDDTGKKKEATENLLVAENRFNGVLLPIVPKDAENLKPPERSEKSKKLAEELQKPKKSIAAGTDEIESIKENKVSTTPEITNTKPPSAPPKSPTPEPGAKIDTTGPAPTQEEVSAVPPQPKPRGLKKQHTFEKAESESTPTRELSPPKPVPRTVAGTKGILPEKKDEAVGTAEGLSTTKEITQADVTSPNNVTIDDFCQTTLPFPAPKHKIGIVGLRSQESGMIIAASGNGNSYSNQSEKGAGSGLLLRPSAFLAATPSNGEVTGTSVLLPILNASANNSPNANSTINNNAAPAAASGSIAIAHIQPKPLATVEKPTPPPTAYVSPSLSSSSVKSDAPSSETKKKEDDSAQESYLKMLELMEKQDLISTSEDVECPVCFTSLPKGEGVVLRECLHIFCRDCLVGCVQYADDSTVKCPYRDNDYACNNNLQEREIKALVPDDIFEKYLARSVKLAESKIVNTFHCKTPDCTGWCVFEDDVNIFLCPVCKKRNCLTCAAIHEGVDCQKYQRELAIAAETDEDAKQSRLMLEKMIQRGEALDCPACHVVLLKKWGCDWVRCSYCKTEICWVTKGFRWGKEGKGDISGGCKCGVNGVKCHPKCTYCH